MGVDDPDELKPPDPPKTPLDYSAAGRPVIEPGKPTPDEADDDGIEDLEPAQAQAAVREAIRKAAGQGPDRNADVAVAGDAPSTPDSQTVQRQDAKAPPADNGERVTELEAKLDAVMQENKDLRAEHAAELGAARQQISDLRAEQAAGFARLEQLLARADGQAERAETPQHSADAPGGSQDRDALQPARVTEAARTAEGDQGTRGGSSADAAASQTREALRNPWRVGERAEASTLRDRQDEVREATRRAAGGDASLGQRGATVPHNSEATEAGESERTKLGERRADGPGGSTDRVAFRMPAAAAERADAWRDAIRIAGSVRREETDEHTDRNLRTRIADRIEKAGEAIQRFASPARLGLTEGLVASAGSGVVHGMGPVAFAVLGGVMAGHSFWYDKSVRKADHRKRHS